MTPTSPAPTLAAAAARDRLVRLSRWGRRGSIAFAFALPLGIAMIWVTAPELMTKDIVHPEAAALSTWLWSIAIAASFVPAVIGIWGLSHLARLFARFEAGEIFGPAAIRHLTRFAQSLLAQAIAAPILSAVLSVTLSAGNPPGLRILAITISGHEIAAILVAALLLTLASAMAEGAEIAEDRRLIV